MVATLHHRGPDDRGTWAASGAGLGAARLSIVDLAGGHQPIASEDGSVVAAQNGEIYNHEALRDELIALGHTFRSRVDTEVLVHGYEAWGAEGLATRLHGMFAVAIYDVASHRLTLIRDRLGVKPLYVFAADDRVVFGSEPKAILAHGDVPRRLDPDAIDLFLTFEFTPAPRTLLRDVRKLRPGSLQTFEPTGRATHRYWRLPEPGALAATSDADAIAGVGARIEEAVRARLMADVPLGALLSGGIDSSTIVSRMAALGVRPLSTFSVGFRDPSYDESAHAEAIATHFGATHHAAGLVPRAVELVDRLLPFLDDPIGDFSIFPTYLVSQLARQRVKVVLSGDGGDEVFGGYDAYLADRVGRRLAWLPAGLRRGAFAMARRMRPRDRKKGMWNATRRFLEGLVHPAELGHMRWMVFLGEADKAEAYGDGLAGRDPEAWRGVVREALDDRDVADPVERNLRLDLALYLPENILLKVDRMSMANSLEARVPLLDHRLVEFVAGLPSRCKLRGSERKWVLRRAVGDWLPPAVLARRKTGFSIPMKTWLRDELRDMVEAVVHGRIVEDLGLIRRDYLRRLVDEHCAGRADHAHRLWAMVVLESWVGQTLAAAPGRTT